MKISKLLFFLILLTSSVFSQIKPQTKKVTKEPSIEETQKWIKSVIDIYGTGFLKFENSKLYYNIPSYYKDDYYNQVVLLQNLYKGRLEKGEDTIHKTLIIDCLNGKSVFVQCQQFNLSVAHLTIRLKKHIPDELFERLIKAFDHLATLSNGIKIGNTF